MADNFGSVAVFLFLAGVAVAGIVMMAPFPSDVTFRNLEGSVSRPLDPLLLGWPCASHRPQFGRNGKGLRNRNRGACSGYAQAVAPNRSASRLRLAVARMGGWAVAERASMS
jgi:hypothetical protein